MVSAATFDDLERYAQGERLGGNRVVFQANTRTPEVGEEVTLRWDFQDHRIDLGTLHIEGMPRMLVQPAGQHSMVAGLDAIEANLRVGNDSANILIHPKIVIPKITQLRLPRKGFMGKPIKFKWKTLDTEQCKLMISNGDGVKEAEVDACGETELHPTHVGVMRVTVTAFSKHADLSEESIVSSEMTMNIKEPPVTIEIPKRFQSAPIGESVCFNWNVLGANQVNLEAIDRNQVWSVPACGALQVAIDIEVERFRLVASNEHSQEKQVEFSTTPEILTSLSDPIDLPNLES